MNSSPTIDLKQLDVPPVVHTIPVEAESPQDKESVAMVGYQPPNLFRHARLGFRLAVLVLAVSVTALACDIYNHVAHEPPARAEQSR